MCGLPGSPVSGLRQCIPQAGRQSGGGADAPIVEEEDARCLVDHVIMDGDNLDVVPGESGNHGGHFFFEHRKIASDSRTICGPLECGPGIESHETAHLDAMRLEPDVRTPDHEAEDSRVRLAAMPDCRLDLADRQRTGYIR